MSGLFSKPKTPKMPPVPPPPPIPEVGPETEDIAMRQIKKRKGFQSTILTGALTPTATKKTVLGG